MRTLLVGYDLNKPGQNYAGLIAKLETYGPWCHELDSTWLLRVNLTTVELRDQLTPFLDPSDKLIVIDVTADPAAWRGFSQQATDWIQKLL